MTPWNSRKNRRSILITNCSEAIHRSTPDHSLPGDRQHSSEFWSAQRIDRLVPTSVPSFLPPLVRTSPPRQPRGQRPTVNSLSFSLFNLVFHKPLSLSLSLSLSIPLVTSWLLTTASHSLSLLRVTPWVFFPSYPLLTPTLPGPLPSGWAVTRPMAWRSLVRSRVHAHQAAIYDWLGRDRPRAIIRTLKSETREMGLNDELNVITNEWEEWDSPVEFYIRSISSPITSQHLNIK